MNIDEEIKALVGVIKTNTLVRAIGLSGGDKPFPKPGSGDIDIFVYALRFRQCPSVSRQ